LSSFQFQDESLNELSKFLPSVINSAIAPNTTKKYNSAWLQWERFCSDKSEITTLPADPFIVSLYFGYLVKEKKSRGLISDSFYGIRWGHISNGYSSPTDHPFTKLAFEGAKRMALFEGSKKKDPFTPEMIKSIVNFYGSVNANLYELRFLIICLLCFSGFLRISKLLNTKLKDLKFYCDYLTVTLEKSKTDQLREGNIVFISKNNSSFCPVVHTKSYIENAQLDSDDYLISRLVKTKHGHKAVGSKKVAYSTISSMFKELAKPVSSNLSLGLHSLRSGGASSAAANNISDRIISKHGRWKSEKGRDGYIKDSISTRLTISKNLGL